MSMTRCKLVFLNSTNPRSFFNSRHSKKIYLINGNSTMGRLGSAPYRRRFPPLQRLRRRVPCPAEVQPKTENPPHLHNLLKLMAYKAQSARNHDVGHAYGRSLRVHNILGDDKEEELYGDGTKSSSATPGDQQPELAMIIAYTPLKKDGFQNLCSIFKNLSGVLRTLTIGVFLLQDGMDDQARISRVHRLD
jgi:hypothetical protein